MSLLTLYSDPGHLIRRRQQIAVAIFIEEVGEKSITPLQYGAMVAIRECPDLDITRLSYLLGQDRSTLGGAIKRLVGKGWIRRVNNPGDKRAKCLRITQKGTDVLTRVEPTIVRVRERILAPISNSDQKVLLDILVRLVTLNNSSSRAPIAAVEDVISQEKAESKSKRGRPRRYSIEGTATS